MIKIKNWLSVEEVSQRLGISKQTVREKLMTKDIRGNKVGREWRILPNEIDRLLGVSTDDKEYSKNLYIKDLEKENEILKNKIITLKSILSSLNEVLI